MSTLSLPRKPSKARLKAEEEWADISPQETDLESIQTEAVTVVHKRRRKVVLEQIGAKTTQR